MKSIPLTPEQVHELIDDVFTISKSSERKNYYSESWRHISAYNELIKLTKEQLELRDKFNEFQFYYLLFKRREIVPLFVKVIVEKNAFPEQFNINSRWFIEHNLENPSLEFYEFIGKLEGYRDYKNDLSQKDFFDFSLGFFYHYDTEEKKNLLEEFSRTYLNDKFAQQYLINYIYDKPTAPISAKLLEILQFQGVDINQDFPLNKLLPDEKNLEPNTPFNINIINSRILASTEFENLIARMKMGFTFDEEHYRYQGNCLFYCLMQSVITNGNIESISRIVPYMKNFSPTSEDREKNETLLEQLKKIHYKDNSLYDFVNKFYLKNLLEQNMLEKPQVKKNKI